MAGPSPLKLKCKWLLPPEEATAFVRTHGPDSSSRKKTVEAQAKDDFRVCRWACVGPVRAARFTDRQGPDYVAIMHPSTKAPGRWQVSYFDAQGQPWSDSEHATCDEAAGELLPWAWRLRDVA